MSIDLQSEHERYLTEYLRVPYRRAADPPWMKPDTCRCPAKAGTHISVAPAAERWTPAFTREALNMVCREQPPRFLVSERRQPHGGRGDGLIGPGIGEIIGGRHREERPKWRLHRVLIIASQSIQGQNSLLKFFLRVWIWCYERFV